MFLNKKDEPSLLGEPHGDLMLMLQPCCRPEERKVIRQAGAARAEN